MKFTDQIKAVREPEYDKAFWNLMTGYNGTKGALNQGTLGNTGAYMLPSSGNDKYEKAIAKESVFRSIASVFTRYDRPGILYSTDCDDIAEYIGENGSIDIKSVRNDFTRISLDSYKLAQLLRLPIDFVCDATFDIENYLTKRLAKSFAHAEDKSYILGNGITEPTGILCETGGAEVGVQTDGITYDDVISLYFSVKPEYRKNAVWLMNDTTAMALRKLKDADGNYLWNNSDNTILGKRVEISEYMPDASAGAKPIAFGNFGYYWIVKRDPISVKTLPETFVYQNQMGYLAFEFLDGKLIRGEAVKVIRIKDAVIGA